MDLSKIDLNAPAFGTGAQKIEAITSEAVAEPVIETPKEEIVETSEEESKVPYSRFKKFHDLAQEARAEAEEWKAKAESFSRKEPVADELPAYWVKLYGDSDASKEAFEIRQKEDSEFRQRTREEALEAVRNERQQETKMVEANIESLDEQFEELTDIVGRQLTEKEQSALLDIVDTYTPKDRDGNYAGSIMAFDKAWEIYELKQQASKLANTQSRDSVAALINNKTQGETSVSTEKDKDFNPLDWQAWRKRI